MLEAFGTVEILMAGGHRGRLVAEGRTLVLEVDEPASLVGLVGPRTLRAIAGRLAEAGFTLHVRSGSRALLSTGPGIRRGLIGRVLRIPATRLDARFALAGALGRRGAARS